MRNASLDNTGSSLPEVVGDAAVIVDPHHTEDIAQGLEKLFLDAALRGTTAKKRACGEQQCFLGKTQPLPFMMFIRRH